jgi:hypothetical protein
MRTWGDMTDYQLHAAITPDSKAPLMPSDELFNKYKLYPPNIAAWVLLAAANVAVQAGHPSVILRVNELHHQAALVPIDDEDVDGFRVKFPWLPASYSARQLLMLQWLTAHPNRTGTLSATNDDSTSLRFALPRLNLGVTNLVRTACGNGNLELLRYCYSSAGSATDHYLFVSLHRDKFWDTDVIRKGAREALVHGQVAVLQWMLTHLQAHVSKEVLQDLWHYIGYMGVAYFARRKRTSSIRLRPSSAPGTASVAGDGDGCPGNILAMMRWFVDDLQLSWPDVNIMTTDLCCWIYVSEQLDKLT